MRRARKVLLVLAVTAGMAVLAMAATVKVYYTIRNREVIVSPSVPGEALSTLERYGTYWTDPPGPDLMFWGTGTPLSAASRVTVDLEFVHDFYARARLWVGAQPEVSHGYTFTLVALYGPDTAVVRITDPSGRAVVAEGGPLH